MAKIKPEMVPEGVAFAAQKAFYEATGPRVIDDWRFAIAAAINAWPMPSPYDHYVTPDGKPCASIILPLTEKTDG